MKSLFLIFLILISAACSQKDGDFTGLSYRETPLKEFATLSPDTLYCLFAFIPSCAHCQNSIANLNRYEYCGTVDKVIGLTVRDSAATAFFTDEFEPKFEIRQFFPSQLLSLTHSYPAAYFIRNSIVIYQTNGDMPSSYSIRREILK